MAPDISTGSDTRQHPAEGIQLAAGLSRQHGLAVFPVDRESRSNGRIEPEKPPQAGTDTPISSWRKKVAL